MTRTSASRYWPATCLGLFALWWTLLALAPRYREDWLLENALVIVAVPWLAWAHRRVPFSNAAITGLLAFFMLHQVGAHYTYSEVPYGEWLRAITGGAFGGGEGRNHFDRLVHLCYGLLVAPAAVELLDARAPQRGAWRWWLPWFFLVSHSTLFELIEAAAAGVFGGDLGQAYLGTQGDVWDAHKDSGLAALGAAVSILWLRRTDAGVAPV